MVFVDWSECFIASLGERSVDVMESWDLTDVSLGSVLIDWRRLTKVYSVLKSESPSRNCG